MAEAGYPDGFETTLSFDLGLASINEPLTMLVQESLAQIGIKTTINKIPGANWRGELLKKDMPMIINAFGGWLNYPEYFFFWCYHGQNAVFNTMGYKNPAMDALIDKARFTTGAGVRGGGEGLHRHRLRGGAARAALPAAAGRGDAEERHRLPLLVPSPARLPPAREGLTGNGVISERGTSDPLSHDAHAEVRPDA